MVLLLAVRARSASLLVTLIVFEAPPQEGLVRSVPTTLGVRSFHRFPAYVPLTFHRFLRAEWSQQEGMSEHQWPHQFGDASGSGDGESGRARAAHGGSCRICHLRAVHRKDIFMVRAEQEDEQRLREAMCERRSVGICCNESPHVEAARSCLTTFHTASEGVFSEVPSYGRCAGSSTMAS